MKGRVRVYIEGGAEGRDSDNDFRRGWKKFLSELHETAIANSYQTLEVVRGKGRSDTFRRFRKHTVDHPDDLCVLLVDAETAVPAGTSVWGVVASRPGDKWVRPPWATEKHLYLMVHFVETWLLTDHDALGGFFKQGFNPKVLPTTNLEQRSKNDIHQALKKATQNSRKGPYRHGHANQILETLRPGRVKTLSHGRRLFKDLTELIEGKP